MRLAHFTALQPHCPVCRAAPLKVQFVAREEEEDILEGILACDNDACQREYPIVDGIPILVAAIRGWLSANPLQLLQRTDLSPELESLIGDVLGPGSPYDTLRQQVSIYAADHYQGDSAIFLLDRALHNGTFAEGPAIDIGCSVGGTTLALAERLDRLVVGIDLNFAMLRVASRSLREQRVQYASRRNGLAYDRRDVPITAKGGKLVDFWCCDAAALPFRDRTFAVANALNILDCVQAPRELLTECARIVRSGGTAIVSTPYDWTPTATPVEQWLGGHSQRGRTRGASEPVLRTLLAPHFELLFEDNVTWRLRLHERSTIEYLVHLVVARRATN